MESESLEGVTDVEVMVADHPLAAEDEGFVQSLAMYSVALQNMHSLLSKYHFCSAGSNLPSLPRTKGVVVVGIELENF